MKLIYISHFRFPSEKTHSAFAMKTCEEFAKQGIDVEMWASYRFNPDFRGVDPFVYHGIDRVFSIKKIPAADLMSILPGSLGFYLLLFSFNVVLAVYSLRSIFKKNII